jgi:hypothetical protein
MKAWYFPLGKGGGRRVARQRGMERSVVGECVQVRYVDAIVTGYVERPTGKE